MHIYIDIRCNHTTTYPKYIVGLGDLPPKSYLDWSIFRIHKFHDVKIYIYIQIYVISLLISIWPVWGWLSFPMIFTMFLGFLNTGHFLPNHQISNIFLYIQQQAVSYLAEYSLEHSFPTNSLNMRDIGIEREKKIKEEQKCIFIIYIYIYIKFIK